MMEEQGKHVETHAEDNASEASMSDFEAGAKTEGSRRKTKVKAAEVKTKLVLTTPAEHPLNLFLAEAKKRGIRAFEPGDIILAALERVEESWWEEKLDELTPLEYKITAALSDPNMREKLTSLLASQKLGPDDVASALQ